ncbi:MAG: hypothetical protein ACI87N_003412, partial [Flavobacteriales bacterium]
MGVTQKGRAMHCIPDLEKLWLKSLVFLNREMPLL